MKKLWILLIFISCALQCNAQDTVYIPKQNILQNNDKIIIKSDTYDSNSGYDYTGKGKPRYYDPMYHDYYIEDSRYNLFNSYPAFYFPTLRGKSK